MKMMHEDKSMRFYFITVCHEGIRRHKTSVDQLAAQVDGRRFLGRFPQSLNLVVLEIFWAIELFLQGSA